MDHRTSIDQQAIDADRIRSKVGDLTNYLGLDGNDFRAFWRGVKHINELFKNSSLNSQDYHSLRAEMSSICRSVKDKQQEYNEILAHYSRKRRSMVLDLIIQARGCPNGGAGDLASASALLKKALNFMKGDSNSTNLQTGLVNEAFGDKGRLTRQDQEECWKAYTSAQELVRSRRQVLIDHDYGRASNAVGAALREVVKGDPERVKELIKQSHRLMRTAYINNDQRQELRSDLDRAWDLASSRQQEAYKKKQRAWSKRQETRIESQEGALKKAEDAAERVRENIYEHEKRLAGDCSAEYQDRVEGWILDSQSKLSDILSSISSLRSIIKGDKRRLR